MAKVLVVEDDSSNAEVIQLVLQTHQHTSICIKDGKCLDLILSRIQPDLIIMDIMLNGEDGRDLCQAIKQNKDTAQIPVLLLTALLESQLDASYCKADQVMFKPFDHDKLMHTVNSLISDHSQ